MLEGESKGHLRWRLRLGPGDELGELVPLLAALAGGPVQGGGAGLDPAAGVDQVSDVAELMGRAPYPGRLLLAGDGFPLEDIGLVRRFLANNPHWELVLIGRDPGALAPRQLLAFERTRWLAWPPDLEQLRWLVRPPDGPPPRPEPPPEGPSRAPTRSAAPAAPAVPAGRREPEDPELADERPAAELHSAGSDPDRTPPEAAARTWGVSAPSAGGSRAEGTPRASAPAAGLASAPPGAPGSTAAAGPGDRPPSSGDTAAPLGDYVGPLADLVQRVDLSMGLYRDTSPDAAQAADEVDGLRQMTHMLKRVAAPPGRGAERFDAGELFEERLAAITIQSPREVRFLPRGERGHAVRADRGAVSEALSSLLALARGCTAPSGVVLAPFAPTADGRMRLELEFPAGPLTGLDPAQLIEPGGLAGRVAGIGAADLPAARSLARSQGGELVLAAEPGDRLRATLELPLEAGSADDPD